MLVSVYPFIHRDKKKMKEMNIYLLFSAGLFLVRLFPGGLFSRQTAGRDVERFFGHSFS